MRVSKQFGWVLLIAGSAWSWPNNGLSHPQSDRPVDPVPLAMKGVTGGTIENDVDQDYYYFETIPARSQKTSVTIIADTLLDSELTLHFPDGTEQETDSLSWGASCLTVMPGSPPGRYDVCVGGFAEFTTGTYYMVLSATQYLPHNDFDLDGKTDPAVYEEATGLWGILLSGSGYRLVSFPLGGPGWETAPGDYDGDGKTDPAVYQETTGLWAVMVSSAGYSIQSLPWGGLGHGPVPGDYDGDAKTDLAVFAPVNGEWSALLSGRYYAPVSAVFGAAGDQPIPADYDGDGKTDPAVYRPSAGILAAALSGAGYQLAWVQMWSVDSGSQPVNAVSGDYDGDGKADPALYQEETGLWMILSSASRYQPVFVTFGGTGFIPVHDDYDGDGKTDFGVYQASAGTWIVLLSGSRYASAGGGLGRSGCVPVR